MIKAQCHCGNVQLTFESVPDTMTQCNCSICRRYAVRWLYFKQKEVKLDCSKEAVQYIWGDKMIAFHHCPICGCITHYTSVSGSDFDRIAINANLLSGEIIENLKVRYFDGASM